MHPEGPNFSFFTGCDPQRYERQMSCLFKVVLGVDSCSEITFRFEQLGGALDNLVDSRSGKLLTVRQAKVTGQGAFEKVVRFEPNRTEEEIRPQVEREIGPAIGGRRGVDAGPRTRCRWPRSLSR